MRAHWLGFACIFALWQAPSAAAGTAVRMDLAGLVDGAELVFEGRVLSASPRIDERGRIETEYAVQVAHTWLGDELAVRRFCLPGGVLPDGRGMVLSGMPNVRAGEDVVLFLSGESATSGSTPGLRMPVGLAQGKFKVAVDAVGRKTLERSLVGLSLVDPATGAVQPADANATADYAIFTAEIADCAALKRARAARTPGAAAGEGAR